jgi:hypothetical protein
MHAAAVSDLPRLLRTSITQIRVLQYIPGKLRTPHLLHPNTYSCLHAYHISLLPVLIPGNWLKTI